MKKVMTILSAVGFTLTLMAGNSFAAWSACTPAAIGPKGDIVRVKVTGCSPADPSGGKLWLTLNATGTDQQMATILTAMSLNKPISVQTLGNKDAENYFISNSIIFVNN